jgi:hypothetical protein
MQLEREIAVKDKEQAAYTIEDLLWVCKLLGIMKYREYWNSREHDAATRILCGKGEYIGDEKQEGVYTRDS